MKKLSKRHRRTLIHRHHRVMKIRRKHNFLGHLPIVLLGKAVNVTLTINNNHIDAFGYRLRPPEIFCFEENPTGTLKFLDNFRKLILRKQFFSPRKKDRNKHHHRKWIGTFADIASIKKITPSAALILATEYDRAKRKHRGENGVINSDQWSSSVSGMLVDIGFFEHLNTKLPDKHIIDLSSLNTKILKMITGNQSITKEIDRLNEGLERLMNSVIDKPLKHAVFAGLTEAMDNCANHAYPRNYQFVYPVIRGC
ncbi:MAG: hypothetical protein OXC62_16385 [Aestuariivita sp.]|nr:hypothetical protein [Aestuariivita sp.]